MRRNTTSWTLGPVIVLLILLNLYILAGIAAAAAASAALAAVSVAVSAAGVTVTNNAGIKDDLSGPGGSPGSPFSNGYHLMSPYNHYNLTSGPPPGPDQQSMVS